MTYLILLGIVILIMIGISTMSSLDDVKTAIARLNTSTSTELKAIADKLSSLPAGGATEADLIDIATQINATADKLDAETAILTAPSDGTTT